MKFGSSYTDYQDTLKFGISIPHCLGVYFFPDTVYISNYRLAWVEIIWCCLIYLKHYAASCIRVPGTKLP